MDENPDLLYEENEVLWAKIRGYPWWPAYVDEVYSGESISDYEYTEVSSRLGPSKLRKFFENYSECYSKSKSNKKLRQSVEKAEERLKENSQDISMYESIRNDLLNKKKKIVTEQSRLSSSEKEEKSEMPILSKRKTDDNYFAKNKIKEEPNKEELFEESFSSNQKSEHSEKEGPDPLRQTFTRLSKKSRSELVNPNLNGAKKLMPPSRKVSHIREKKNNIKVSKVEQENNEISDGNSNNLNDVENEEEEEEAKEKLEDEINKEYFSKVSDSEKISEIPIKKGRRGRPPKFLHKKKEAESYMESEEESNDIENCTPAQNKREDRRKVRVLQNQENQENENENFNQNATLNENEIIMINSCLNNPKQLAKVLIQMSITTKNVKEILDLGVSRALQEGVCTKIIYVLLCTLKATLLHRYFPDDIKYRKKFEKMMKEKKKVAALENEDENESDNGVMEDEKNVEKTQEKLENSKKIENEDEKQKHDEIRTKANEKLEKMIRKAGLNHGVKELAEKVENSFQLTADQTGEAYKSIAYERMRKLKTKLTYFSEYKAKESEIQEYLHETLSSFNTPKAEMIDV